MARNNLKVIFFSIANVEACIEPLYGKNYDRIIEAARRKLDRLGIRGSYSFHVLARQGEVWTFVEELT